jgi:hypothetical protein
VQGLRYKEQAVSVLHGNEVYFVCGSDTKQIPGTGSVCVQNAEFWVLKNYIVLGIEGNRPLGRPKIRWEDNIKLDCQEVCWVAWTGLIWLRIGTSGGHLRMR